MYISILLVKNSNRGKYNIINFRLCDGSARIIKKTNSNQMKSSNIKRIQHNILKLHSRQFKTE